MIPYTRNHDDEDGENDYITFTPSHSSQVLLDSSSSNGSSQKDDNIEGQLLYVIYELLSSFYKNNVLKNTFVASVFKNVFQHGKVLYYAQ